MQREPSQASKGDHRNPCPTCGGILLFGDNRCSKCSTETACEERDSDIRRLLDAGKIDCAIESLYERYREFLSNFVANAQRSFSAEDVKDVVMEAYEKVYLHWSQGRVGRAGVAMQLFLVARNLGIDRYRRRREHLHDPFVEDTHRGGSSHSLQRFEELLVLFTRFVSTLSGQQKLVAQMMTREVPGKLGPGHLEEVAAMQGMCFSKKSIKRALEEVRRKFRDYLEEHYES